MFHFRLQTLLRLRIAERDQRRADLAKAIRAEEVLRAEEQRVLAEQAAVAERSQALKSPGAADVDSLMTTHRYGVVLLAQRKQIASQLAQVQAESERRRLAVVEADRQVRVLEMLRDRQFAAYRQAEEREEIKQFDEIAIMAARRRQEAVP
jgi:flagellar export protein FliJ